MSFQIVKSARSRDSCAGALNVTSPSPEQAASATAGYKRTFVIQAAFTALFFVAFLLYLPIGLAVVAPFKRLTIEQVPTAPFELEIDNQRC